MGNSFGQGGKDSPASLAKKARVLLAYDETDIHDATGISNNCVQLNSPRMVDVGLIESFDQPNNNGQDSMLTKQNMRLDIRLPQMVDIGLLQDSDQFEEHSEGSATSTSRARNSSQQNMSSLPQPPDILIIPKENHIDENNFDSQNTDVNLSSPAKVDIKRVDKSPKL